MGGYNKVKTDYLRTLNNHIVIVYSENRQIFNSCHSEPKAKNLISDSLVALLPQNDKLFSYFVVNIANVHD